MKLERDYTMAKVIITDALFKIIKKKFSTTEADLIIDILESLETKPHKGTALTNIGKVLIKEIKHKKYRFYCITDGHILKFGTEEEISSLLIKFVKMSDKKDQQKTINEIKHVLISMGFKGF